MTTNISTSTAIARQQIDVWDFIANFENSPLWMPEVDSVKHLDGDELGRGSILQFEFTGKTHQRQISYWESGKSFALIFGLDGNTSETSFKLVSPTDATTDKTIVEMNIKLELHGVRLFLIPFVIWSTKRNADKQLAFIKRKLERDLTSA